jgi:2-polyprenyl-6-methoxyphenol hydroxylase-like FAD-dependent oxidoreductase/sugar lactone lactonase YvrE
MQNIDCDVVIVGGGVAGGSLACNLRDAGLRVVLLEMAPSTPQINRGDELAPCTVRWLDKVGALPNFFKRGAEKVTRWKAIGPEGETIVEVPLAATTYGPHNYILTLPHPLIEEALLETATDNGAVQIVRGCRATGLIKDDTGMAGGVTAVRSGEEIRVHARIVAGCDGPRSVIRQHAGLNTELHTYPYEYLMLTCILGEEQPSDLNIEVWGADGFCGFFPITNRRVRCPVQAEPGEMARWRRIGLKSVLEELRQRFPYFRSMQVVDDDLHVYKMLRHHVDSYAADGVVITGDAAHCTPPYYGIGMTLAMRDSFHAARQIKQVLAEGGAPTRERLRPFEALCRNYNQFVINASQNYGSVAAARLRTAGEVQRALQSSTALDADVMAAIYADYDTPPPQDTDPTKVSRYIQGIASAKRLQSRRLAEGYGFCEAPRWRPTADGAGELWFVDFFSQHVVRMDAAGRATVVATVPGMPGGLGFLPDGTPLVVSQQQRKLYRIGEGGELSEYADLTAYARGCANELLVDAQGRAYVGHHGFDFLGGAELEPASLILVDTDRRVREVATELIFPNGTALSPDGRTLIVAESFAMRLTAFDVATDGSLSNRRVWAETPGYTPDGICLDAEGAVWAGSPLASAFVRVEPGGRITHRVPTDGRWAVACTLGGPDRRTLYCVTADTSLSLMPKGISNAFVEAVAVEVPGAGLP